MILSEKIIKLRKQLGWSQEELAEKMDVSRQSVSKWESTNSIPDLNKIILLAKIFNVSTDFLLKDDIDTAEYLPEGGDPSISQVSLEQAMDYIETIQEKAKLTVKGVSFFVCSTVPLFFLLALSHISGLNLERTDAVAFGLLSIFLMVPAGIRLLIKTNHFDRILAPFENNRFELAYGVHSACSEKLESILPRYNNRLSLGVTLFITSSIPLLLVAILFQDAELIYLMLAALMLIVSAGLAVVIPATSEYEAYKHILNEGDKNRELSQSERNASKLAPFYWPLTLAIYLGWSLWTMHWGITWIVFPVAAVLFASLVGLMGLLDKENG